MPPAVKLSRKLYNRGVQYRIVQSYDRRVRSQKRCKSARRWIQKVLNMKTAFILAMFLLEWFWIPLLGLKAYYPHRFNRYLLVQKLIGWAPAVSQVLCRKGANRICLWGSHREEETQRSKLAKMPDNTRMHIQVFQVRIGSLEVGATDFSCKIWGALGKKGPFVWILKFAQELSR